MDLYRKFFTTLTGLILVNSLAVVGINAIVDPYHLAGTQVLANVTGLKPDSSKDARKFKAIKVMRIKPKAIFLGTSRADIGLSPDHPALTQPAYNLAIPSGDMYEAMRYFQHALANQPELEQVVIGIDMVAFGVKEDAVGEELSPEIEKILSKTNYLPELPTFLFSTDAFKSSLSTLAANFSHSRPQDYYLSNGKLVRHNPTDRSILNVFELHLKQAYFSHWYFDYQTSQKQLGYFKTIVDSCKQKGIDLKVFISPAHVTQWEAIRAAGLWSAFEDWKREVVKVTPVWDFSGYNSITSEAISDQMQNYLESSHYREHIGDLVLNRMLNYEVDNVPGDFGTLVTENNIEPQLAKIRAERERWAKQNPDMVKLVERWSQE